LLRKSHLHRDGFERAPELPNELAVVRQLKWPADCLNVLAGALKLTKFGYDWDDPQRLSVRRAGDRRPCRAAERRGLRAAAPSAAHPPRNAGWNARQRRGIRTTRLRRPYRPRSSTAPIRPSHPQAQRP